LRIGYVAEAVDDIDAGHVGWLVIPYLSPSGVIQMKFRSMDANAKMKYVYDIGATHRPYNTMALMSPRKKIVITEGELDCASLLQSGVAAVGLPGVKSWKEEWARIFRNREVTVCCDGDQPGREFGKALVSMLYGARMVVAPEGEDANSVLVKKGEEELRRMVSS
jgi:5S rRNA maturation endonuclease (ribonuclease M5)